MTKPYFYLDRYVRDRFRQPIQRLMSTDVGSHVRVAFHDIGDGTRSLEVYVQPNGWWSVETSPGPVHSGERVRIASGRLPGEWGPETTCIDGVPFAVVLVKSGATIARFSDRVTAERFASDFPRVSDSVSNTCVVET